MQLHPVSPSTEPAMSRDMWMVRATHTSDHDVERYTTVDLEDGDTTPGVYPVQFEHGVLHAPAPGATEWTAAQDRIEAWDDSDAARVAHSTYDAARAFLELRIAPDTGAPSADFRPDQLTLDIGDDRWTFPAATAPAQAWAVLTAARRVR